MYNVTLVNLTADARAVASLAHFEQREVGHEDLLVLLRNFCAIDPVENAAGATEIRIRVRAESYLIRTEQGRLVLYDVLHREVPGQLYTLEQIMPELDGTAGAGRSQAIAQARAEAQPSGTVPVLAARPSDRVASKPRLIALGLAVAVLLAAIVYVNQPFALATPEGFSPLPAPEVAPVLAALAGVYLTGSEPGEHGIVVTGPGELKLFELGVVEAPRMVYASYQPGRLGGQLCLATNQPGGLIAVGADGSLVYGAETYRRIP